MKLDAHELAAHAVLAAAQPTMQGYLLKQGRVNTGSWKKRYFCLRGPMLYYFRTKDPTTCIGLICIDHAEVSAGSLNEVGAPPAVMNGWDLSTYGEDSNPPTGLLITTCSGRRITLVAPTQQARDEWYGILNIPEDNACDARHGAARCSELRGAEGRDRFVTGHSDIPAAEVLKAEGDPDAAEMFDCLETYPAEMHMHDIKDFVSFPSECPVVLRAALADAKIAMLSLEAKIAQAKSERHEAEHRFSMLESEHQKLLTSKGVAVQRSPSIAPSAGDTSTLRLADVKIWVGTWNLGVTEPFSEQEVRGQAPQLLRERFMPAGCDLYCLGVQEAPSEKLFGTIEGLLSLEGIRRVNFQEEGNRTSFADGVEAATASASTSLSMYASTSHAKTDLREDKERRCVRVEGRGDGSLLSSKFTGLVLFASDRLRKRGFRVVATGSHGLDRFSSKGAAAVGIAINVGDGTAVTMAFLSCHLEAGDKSDIRCSQYRELSEKVSALICAPGLEVTTQFHHVVWVGDMNYRCLEAVGGPQMKPESVLNFLERGEARTLFDEHDGLNIARRSQDVFYRYREAEPFPDFFPTYKLLEDRAVPDVSKDDWTHSHYCTRYKEPFYKGGSVKDRTPGFCDRILFHSQADVQCPLEPEVVEVPLEIHPESSADATSLLCTRIHNYQTVAGGAGFASSDHAPVFATFCLRMPGIHEGARLRARTCPASMRSARSATFSMEIPEDEATCSTPSRSLATPVSYGYPNEGRLRFATEELLPHLPSYPEARAINTVTLEPPPLEQGSSMLVLVLGSGPVEIIVADLRITCGPLSVCPTGAEISFPAPWEAEPCPSGAPAVDVLPSSSSRWRVGSQGAVAGNEESGSLRVILAGENSHVPEENLPELRLGWRGQGGGAVLQHLHLVARVMLPESLAAQVSHSRQHGPVHPPDNTHHVSQASFALGPLLLPVAAEAWRKCTGSPSSDGEDQGEEVTQKAKQHDAQTSDEEAEEFHSDASSEDQQDPTMSEFLGLDFQESGSSSAPISTASSLRLISKPQELIVHADEILIRHGMPEYLMCPGGVRQQCRLSCKLRVKADTSARSCSTTQSQG